MKMQGILVSVIVCIFFTVGIWANPPWEINIQGTLESPDGGPLTGSYDYLIGFYNIDSGGASLSEVTGTIELSDTGRFSIAVQFDDEMIHQNEIWYQLSVDVNGNGFDEDDLFPQRVRILSVPFSVQSFDSINLNGIPSESYATDEELIVNLAAKSDVGHTHDDVYWNLHGNILDASESFVLGTLNDSPVELIVNSQSVLRLIPTTGSPNVIAGYRENEVVDDATGATISGGGGVIYPNYVIDNFGTVGGGSNNHAGSYDGLPNSSPYSTVSGGHGNMASGYASVVGGGGGYSLGYLVGNTAADEWCTVSGGHSNTANGNSCTVSGGYNNISNAWVGSTISGGGNNSAGGALSVVSGGYMNVASGDYSVIGGGQSSTASGQAGTISGGIGNNASGYFSTISGGAQNVASGTGSIVPGGFDNSAYGQYSFAAGRGAKANHDGAFVWADSTASSFSFKYNQ